MGLNHISLAAVIALLGASTALHAEETASQQASPVATTPVAPAPAADPTQQSPDASANPAAPTTAAPAPSDDPALKASPIADTAQPAPAAGATGTPTPATTKGDVLKIPKQKTPAAKKKKTPPSPIQIEDGMPGRGASMTQVEKRFGQPLEKLPPVGTPPITRWIYSNYTVYFEHEYVIHSVRNEGAAETVAPAQPAAPEPMPQQPAAPASESAPVPAEPAVPETPAMHEMPVPPATGPVEAKPASGQ